MEEYAARIELAPEPRSAPQARRWIRGVLDELDRPDLTEAASAGVSELVTNGVLHANTAISLVVQVFSDRVVISVTDRSPVHNRVSLEAAAANDDESTTGRGLHLVRSHAEDWGIMSSQHGKVIWFVPSDTASAVDIDLSAPELLGDDEASEPPFEGPVTRVVMLDAPVRLLRQFHERWNELLREMHLIALGEPSSLQALARELVELVRLTRAERWMTPESTADLADAVLNDTTDRLDITLDVPEEVGAAYRRVLAITRSLEEEAHQDLLLYVGTGPQEDQLRDWWFGDVAQQLSGEPPTPWPGSFTAETTDHSG